MEQDLKPTPICDYAGFERLMEQGNANKIVAATKMNATSSRAHTIIEVQFKQTYTNDVGKEMQRISVMREKNIEDFYLLTLLIFKIIDY